MDLLCNDTEIPLEQLRATLVRLEDTITFAFIERAEFKLNPKIYCPGEFYFPDAPGRSFLEYFLHEVESVHAKVRRYTSPDEYPFTDNLPEPVLPPLNWPNLLAPNKININNIIYKVYTDNIITKICIPGDDLNYGTSATRDIEVLQALSRRIHYGKFIAEAKFRDPKLHSEYVKLIKNNDSDGIMELLTDKKVEERLLARLRKKAAIYGQDVVEGEDAPHTTRQKIRVDLVAEAYRDFVIPLTKKVEVDYLLQRLDSGEH